MGNGKGFKSKFKFKYSEPNQLTPLLKNKKRKDYETI